MRHCERKRAERRTGAGGRAQAHAAAEQFGRHAVRQFGRDLAPLHRLVELQHGARHRARLLAGRRA